MADCSELSKLITEVAMNIASREDVKNLDDVILQMGTHFPDLPRTAIVEAINETTSRQAAEVSNLVKKLQEIRSQARMETRLKEKVKKIEDYLETGVVPGTQKRTKPTTFAIEELRKTSANLNKWLRTSDPAMKKVLEDRLKSLQDAVENGEIEVESEGKFHEALQPIVDAIADARTKIQDAKDFQRLQDKIDALRKHLEEGTLPAKQARQEREHSEIYDALRDVRDDLKKQLRTGDPAQKQRVQKQIDTLEERLKSGDVLPKPKIETGPQSKELQRLIYERDQLRNAVKKSIYNLRPKTLTDRIVDPFNFVRLIQTTGEFSLVLRQGGFYAYGHPLKAADAVIKALQAFADPIAAAKIQNQILNRELAPVAARAKLHISPSDGTTPLTQLEEAYMTHWSEKIPIIRNFTRAGLVFINKARADSFDALYRSLGKTHEATDEEAKLIANFVNVATGRGSLGAMEQAAVPMNTVFYAPRYVASRFQLLLGQPLWTTKGKNSIQVRGLIAGEYGRFFIGLATIYALGLLAGGDVEPDPRSSDFGKIRFGKTRIDPLLGLGQITVFLTRLITGETKSTRTGKITPIRGEKVPYGGTTTPDVLTRFLRSKLSPLFGLTVDLLAGENVIGEKVTPGTVAKNFLVPITWNDIVESMQEQGVPKGMAMSLMAIFGMGMQTYQDNQQTTRRRTSARR